MKESAYPTYQAGSSYLPSSLMIWFNVSGSKT